jgi:hypothetical protein
MNRKLHPIPTLSLPLKGRGRRGVVTHMKGMAMRYLIGAVEALGDALIRRKRGRVLEHSCRDGGVTARLYQPTML